MVIRLKRAYHSASSTDGVRVLVDRIWPRGMSKADLAIDRWAKDLAPSPELRRWFGHDLERWEEFAHRYQQELDDSAKLAIIRELGSLAQEHVVTLVYGARDPDHNQAVILKDVIEQQAGCLDAVPRTTVADGSAL